MNWDRESWYIESLLLNRLILKETLDITNDVMWDILQIEDKIVDMYYKNLLSSYDLGILELITSGKPFEELAISTGLNRNTLSKKFRIICGRIGWQLAGYFPNVGYLKYMQQKYNLNREQVEVIKEHMTSKYKHKIRRKDNEIQLV